MVLAKGSQAYSLHCNHISGCVSCPRAQASRKDYETKNESGPCFPGTREALLREMMDWMTEPGGSKMYVLSGLTGIGKSTVVYTLATQAAELGLLGASIFFSRDEADRRSAKRFFSTIAYQLCAYDKTFFKAIGDTLLAGLGSAATTKTPQLQALILLDALRTTVQSCSQPILIVVDALDECDEEDTFSVLTGLSQLVRDLPSFKVILSTRPQPYLDQFLNNQGGHKFFRLQDIEDKVVDGDIRLYLQHNLSLEQVQRRYPNRQWCASDEEIDSLVRAAGRLFIIASTAVRYIFDKSASNPAAQMQTLRRAFSQDHTPVTPFKDIDHFYTIILRNVVPENCDDDGIVSRYQSVVGTIISVQRPLPVSTLAHFIDVDVEEIHAVLDRLQSVILLGSDDVPRTYHISLPDYLTDQARCKDPRLRIDTRIRHTQIAIRCFQIMNIRLKYNISGLGDPARFMSNKYGLKEDGITDEQLQEKIPQQLRYACVHWVNHFEVANNEDADLMNGLAKFVDDHLLHWLEVLSLIGNLDLAHRAIRVTQTSTSSDLCQLLLDALRFISKFYELIERSALHTYHSALPFTPTDSLLYRRYIKEARHNICSIEDGLEKWDVLVANLNHGEQVGVVKFSVDSTLFVSCSKGKSKIWDATTGTPISTIPGHRLWHSFEFSGDGSRIVSVSSYNRLTLWNSESGGLIGDVTYDTGLGVLAISTNGSLLATADHNRVKLWSENRGHLAESNRNATIVTALTLSRDCSRLACGFKDGTVELWGTSPTKQRIASHQAHTEMIQAFGFGPGGELFAAGSDGTITLWNGKDGSLVATLIVPSGLQAVALSDSGLVAAGNGSHDVTLWSLHTLKLIHTFKKHGDKVSIAENSAVIAVSRDNIVSL
ncbi:hypothetical protein M378DRAFT_89420, partial [Amanita muscaria Koide BX008]